MQTDNPRIILSNYTLTGETYQNDNPILAAVDLGTNSCRLLVARPDQTNLKIIDSYSKVTRLGEGMHITKYLSKEAMKRALDSLSKCAEKIDRHDVKILRCVTTEACRRAVNAQEFLQQVKERTNLNLEIISPQEEARLAITGCSALLSENASYALAFDIGGGSTEILWLKVRHKDDPPFNKWGNIEVIDWISIPLGVVTLSEGYGAHVSHPKAYADTCERIQQRLDLFCLKNNIAHWVDQEQVQMIGTSGTVTTLAAIFLDLERYDRKMIDGFTIGIPDLINICQQILHMEEKERVNHACIGVERAGLIVMGAAILEGICSMWDLPSVVIADRGVREGILIDLFRHYMKNTGNKFPENGVFFL